MKTPSLRNVKNPRFCSVLWPEIRFKKVFTETCIQFESHKFLSINLTRMKKPIWMLSGETSSFIKRS